MNKLNVNCVDVVCLRAREGLRKLMNEVKVLNEIVPAKPFNQSTFSKNRDSLGSYENFNTRCNRPRMGKKRNVLNVPNSLMDNLCS